jgi:molecular chaperone DnaJ
MADETDFYALLGVSRTATDDEIKKAYRARARELHPDANPDDPKAEERFKQVSVAYEVLKDPEKKRVYDQYGIDGLRQGGGAGDPFAGFGGLGDIFEAFFGGNPFGGGGGGGRGRPAGPPRGRDQEIVIDLDFAEAVFGTQKEVTIKVAVGCETCSTSGAAPGTNATACSQCSGTGEIRMARQTLLGQMVTASPCGRCAGTGRMVETPCPTCRGEGRRNENRTYTIDVPAGVDSGVRLRYPGRGGVGQRGGDAGDLFVALRVKEHERFQRYGHDITELLELPMSQAALGALLKYETLDGIEDLLIPAGTQTGKEFRLRGRGVPLPRGTGRGDLVVTALVVTPTRLSKEEDLLLRQFAEARGEEVGPTDTSLLGKIRSAFR